MKKSEVPVRFPVTRVFTYFNGESDISVFFKGTGDIDFDEFCTLMARMMGLDGMDDEAEAEESHKEAFKLLDQRGTGQISATHFKEILGSISEKLSQSEINQIIEEIDPDHDGKINFSGTHSLFGALLKASPYVFPFA